MFQEISFYTHQLLTELAERGFDQGVVLKGAEIPERQLTGNFLDPFPLDAHFRLMREALKVTGDPSLFLKSGRRLMAFTEMGMAGVMLASCPSPLAAMLQGRDLVKAFRGPAPPPIKTSIDIGDETVTVIYEQTPPQAPELGWLTESLMAAQTGILEGISGRAIAPIAVSLAHAPLADPKIYEEMLGTAALFEQEQSLLQFTRKSLDILCPLASQDVNAAAWTHLLSKQVPCTSIKLSPAIARAIWQMIMERRPLTLPDVAGVMGMSARTIQHRLKQEETSFAEILSDIRFTEAKRLLSSEQLSIEMISRRLGYSEPASFSNAFRSWQGESPGEFRKKNLHVHAE